MSMARILGSAVAGAAAYAVGVYTALFVVLSAVGLSDAVDPWYPVLAIVLGTAASAGAVTLSSGVAGRVWRTTTLTGAAVGVLGTVLVLTLQTDFGWLVGIGVATVAAETAAAALAAPERTSSRA